VPYFLVQHCCYHGATVAVSSAVVARAHASVGTLSAYAATKGAIDTLVKHFASALANEAFASMRAPAWYDRHVELRQDRIGTRFHAGHPGAQRMAAPKHRCSDYFLASMSSLDNRRHLRVDGARSSDVRCTTYRPNFMWKCGHHTYT